MAGRMGEAEGNKPGRERMIPGPFAKGLECSVESALYTGGTVERHPAAATDLSLHDSEISMRNAAKSNLLVPEIREVMDIRQASDYLGISPDTLYKYASEAFVPAFKLGNRWRFKRSRLDEWMDRQSDAMTAQPEPEVGAKTRKPVKAAY